MSRITAAVERTMREPDSSLRATQIMMAERPYRLEVQADPDKPIVHIYAQAPSAAAALDLANASVEALRE